ncbi:MAG: MATE family efflux transporter, partial [Oscillospiraceae bacterium]
MARINDLGNDNVKSLVFRLAIPSMCAQLVNVLYGIVDRIFIGNIPEIGEVALAGAGVCGPIVTLVSSFAFLIGIGGAPLLAMRLGEKN